jgi:hypothetical protein
MSLPSGTLNAGIFLAFHVGGLTHPFPCPKISLVQAPPPVAADIAKKETRSKKPYHTGISGSPQNFLPLLVFVCKAIANASCVSSSFFIF